MKKYSKAELQADAERLMKAHGKDTVFATQDNNFFFSKGDANNHNFTLKKDHSDDEFEVFEFSSSAATAAPVDEEAEKLKADYAQAKEAQTAAADNLKAHNAAVKEADKLAKDADKTAGKLEKEAEAEGATDEQKNAAAEARKNANELKQAHEDLVQKTPAFETAAEETKTKAAELKAALKK